MLSVCFLKESLLLYPCNERQEFGIGLGWGWDDAIIFFSYVGNAITYISTSYFVKVEVVDASLYICLFLYLSTQYKFTYKI
jgi:hypothetical protein